MVVAFRRTGLELDLEILHYGIRQHLFADALYVFTNLVRRSGNLELDDLADAEVLHPGVAQSVQCGFDGSTLGIENGALETHGDVHTGLGCTHKATSGAMRAATVW